MKKEQNQMNKPRGFYDLEQIKNIPIVDVCRDLLELSIEKRGNNLWCKSRSERTASTILHPENNTFHDFGTGLGGDVISLVSYVCDIEPASAISMLAEGFHIPRIDQREGMNDSHINDWEYKQIGLHADRATKNFTWDFVRTSIERMYELEEKYAIPMNLLRVKFPKIYEQILKQKALPYLYQLRNDYYLSIRAAYQLVKEVGNTTLFKPEKFDGQIKQLIKAERIFARACVGTSITFTPITAYDPAKDAEKVSNGIIKPSLGNTTKNQLLSAASAADTQVRYRTMDYSAYIKSDISQHDHMAFLKGDVVVVGFLASEYSKFRSYFDKNTSQEKQGLDKQIDMANKSKASVSQNSQKDVEIER